MSAPASVKKFEATAGAADSDAEGVGAGLWLVVSWPEVGVAVDELVAAGLDEAVGLLQPTKQMTPTARARTIRKCFEIFIVRALDSNLGYLLDRLDPDRLALKD